jgi:Tfp pilus assembly protein PilF
VICSTLVFLLILQLFHRVWTAMIGALIFALHPLQTEAVAWASGMYTLLSTALSLGALMAYVIAVGQKEKGPTSNIQRPTSNVQVNTVVLSFVRRWTLNVERWTFAIFFFIATSLYIAALLTKAASVSLPLAAGMIDLFILGRPLRRVIKSLVFWVVLAFPIVLIAKHFQDVSMLPAPPLWTRLLIALDAIGFYLGKIVLPINLIPDYGRNPTWVMHHLPRAGISAATATVVLLIAWRAPRNVKWIPAGIGVLFAGISPYLGLTTFDFQYVSTVADRYAYFGMVGVALLIAAATARSRSVGIVVVIGAVICGVLTFRQIQRWKDTNTLFSYTLDVNPRSLLSHNIFGYLAAREHRPAEARAHYLAALEIWPQDATILFNLGNLYAKDRPDLALEPYASAVRYQPKMALYRNNFAAALARTGDVQQAYAQWKQAITDDPSYVDPHNNLGDLLAQHGFVDEACREYRATLAIDPNNAHANAALQNLNKR